MIACVLSFHCFSTIHLVRVEYVRNYGYGSKFNGLQQTVITVENRQTIFFCRNEEIFFVEIVLITVIISALKTSNQMILFSIHLVVLLF